MTRRPPMSDATTASRLHHCETSGFSKRFMVLWLWPLYLTLATALPADELPPVSENKDPVEQQPQQQQPQQQPQQQLQQQQLLAERDKLILTANGFYQEKKYDEAMQCLRQLLPLYQQIYPVSEYPNGHRHVVDAYQDMCRILKEQKKYSELLTISEEGLHAHSLLDLRDEQVRSLSLAASFHGYIGVACFAVGDLKKARENFLVAAEEYRSMANDDDDGIKRSLLARVQSSLAEISLKEGDISAAADYWSQAIDNIEPWLRNRDTLECRRHASHYRTSRAGALRQLGKFASAVELAKQAHDLSLRAFVVTRANEDRNDVIRNRILLGLLHRDIGNVEVAFQLLQDTLFRIENTSDPDSVFPGLLETVLCNLLAMTAAQGDHSLLETYRNLLRKRFVNREDALRRGIDEIEVAEILRYLGLAFREIGHFDSAERCYREALQGLTETASDPMDVQLQREIVFIRNDLAVSCGEIGRLEDAHTQFVEALRVAEYAFPTDTFPHGHFLLSTVMQNLAMHYWLIGETEKAANLFRKTIAMIEAQAFNDEFAVGHSRVQAAYSAWANVLMREKRFDEAELYAIKANQLILSQPQTDTDPHGRDDLAISWIHFGRLRRARGEFSAAKEWFNKSLQSYELRGRGEHAVGRMSIALVLAELGRTYAAEGDFATALEYHRRSLAIRQELFPQARFPVGHPSLANSLRDVGLTCMDAGETGEAFRTLAQSVTMEHAIGESFFGGGSEAQLLNFAARKFQSLGPLLRAWQQSGLPAEEVYPFVWMRHGLVARLIADRQRLLRELALTNPPAIYQQYIAARQDLSRALLVSVAEDVAGDSVRREWLQQLNAVKEDLERQLTRSLQSNESGRPAAADIQSLAAVLPETAAFVDFFSYSSVPFDATMPSRADPQAAERVVAFVICRDRPVACVDLGDARDIASLVAAWKEALLADAEDTVGAKLRQTVWDPVCLCLPERVDTVYIAPDGIVGAIAWGALPDKAGAGVLLERFAIATVPHGPFLLDQLRKPPSQPVAYTPVLVVGDVDYGNRDGNVATVRQGLNELQWAPLPGSRLELDGIVSGMADREVVLLTGIAATTENVLHGLATARVAHFATHGFFIDDSFNSVVALAAAGPPADDLTVNRVRSSVLGRSPLLRSGLALAGANAVASSDERGIPTAATGILTAETVAATDAGHLQLVVLSACDTSRGDAASGEGILGIQGAFHIAGARNVIAGLWKVPDEATAELMREFYRLLNQEKHTPLTALREAQLHVMRQGGPPQNIPRGVDLAGTVPLDVRPPDGEQKTKGRVREWAGFVLSGPGS
ncbi:MAG: CHAT domain-containing tetratricopeptide repeat protein [Pirellulaceae bacterium]